MKPRIWLALLTVYLVWGSTYLAIHFAVLSLPPFLMAGVRYLVAGLILFVWRRAAGDPFPPKSQWKSAAVIGLLLLLGGNGGLVWAEQFVPSGIASVFIGSTPLWIILIDALRPGGKKPTLLTTIGLLIGFAGIVLMINPGQAAEPQHSLYLPGALVLVCGSFAWALGSVYGRTADLPRSPLMGTGIQMLAGGVGLSLFSMVVGEIRSFDPMAVRLDSIMGLLYLIVFGALVGYSAYTWLLRAAPIPLVATYAYVNPIVALLLGYLLADEQLSARTLIAALVIISSVGVINFSQLKKIS